MNRANVWREYVENGMNRGEPREGYSGRGMYGHTVLAVILDASSDVLPFCQELGAWLAENGYDDALPIPLETDSMGRDAVVVYPRGRDFQDAAENAA